MPNRLKYWLELFTAGLFILIKNAHAQEVSVQPEQPRLTDRITVSYDASRGNAALRGYQGKVYFHAGLITAQSRDNRDWKFVVGNWGQPDARVEMKQTKPDIYEVSFVPFELFGVDKNLTALQIALVFRNADGSLVGKTKDEADILIPLHGYKPPVVKRAEYLFNDLGYKGYKQTDTALIINTLNGDVVIRPYSSHIVQTSWHPDGFKGFAKSHAVIAHAKKINGTVVESETALIYDLPQIQVLVSKKPLRISYFKDGKQVLQDERGLFARTDASGMRFSLEENEKLYGSGFRASGINLRGRKLGLYNRPDYNYQFGADNLNYQVPLLISSKKYMLFVDNPYKAWFDVDSKNDGVLEFGAAGGPMQYYLIVGQDFPSLLKHYADLTGTQPMLPRWAFGNLQSRMAYRTQAETDSIVNLMIEKDFPIDAVILDFYWFGDSILGHLGRLDWWKPSWPDPQKMIADFRSKGVKTITISEPYIIDSLANWQVADKLGILVIDSLGNSYLDKQFYFGTASLIDIFKPEAQQWLWEQYRKLFDIGVEGLWGDLGEPESHPSDIVHVWGKADEVHNIYGHYWAKMIWDNFRRDFPERRLFFLARSGFAGTQRYGIVPWSGDVSRSWGGLKAQLPAMLNMSLSGLPYMHSDAGGFATGIKDDELYTRWLQFSCFTPILRPHGSSIPSEPVFFSEKTQDIVRSFMKLRNELHPYIYTAAWKHTQTGLPITRPLFFHNPSDERFLSYFDAYYFGDDMIVAPITEAGVRTTSVELPNGTWYHFWTGQRVNGGRRVQLQISDETIPIFVKAGSIIPRVETFNTTDHYSSRKLYLHTYLPGSGLSFGGTMFEDDGATYASFETGAYELLSFQGQQGAAQLSIKFSREGNGWAGMPESRLVELILYGQNKNVREVQFGDLVLKKLEGSQEASPTPGFWHDENGIWHIRFVWHGDDKTLFIK
jgi:oligosaccharide 4-alpha-D-glucosyltransferase